MTDESEFIFIEDRDIHDGWCAKLNLKTKEIIWREAYFTERLDKKFKELWEYNFRANNPEFKIIESKPI